MKAQDLANYFTKKIAKPIPYTYLFDEYGSGVAFERNYVVEPIAVAEGILHAVVTLRSETMNEGRTKLRQPNVLCGEVEIPLEDGDSVFEVLAMAIADADFSDQCMRFTKDDLVRSAFEELNARRANIEMRRIGFKV